MHSASMTCLATYARETEDWDVVYDDRGHFVEPHKGNMIGVCTKNPIRVDGPMESAILAGCCADPLCAGRPGVALQVEESP